ncbi:hypothetical protein [Rhodopseudomonas palustris]|uniref:Uncharacterized protein n=1 Tax=Rhodopseudomonas palustris TaxID=1076 RepID=A0A418V336_RHOPL|nr:hypothetical protein [Rhodopseudomonas palustris]RJF70450.1 hypothetical protein D4Q52_16705 [Rhodopseudomonas palustris]
MLELSILGVMSIAAAYWLALWLVGRHEDVLYGSFVIPMPVAGEPRPQSNRAEWPPELPRRPRIAANTAAPAGTIATELRSASAEQAAASPEVLAPAAAGRQQLPLRAAMAKPDSIKPAVTNPAAPNARPQANVSAAATIPPAAAPVAQKAAAPVAQTIASTAAPPPFAVNAGALRRSLPAAHTPPATDVLASLLETIKRDLSEATRR